MSHIARCIFILSVEKTVFHQDEQPAFLNRRLFYFRPFISRPLSAIFFVFGAEGSIEAKSKQPQDNKPTRGHK